MIGPPTGSHLFVSQGHSLREKARLLFPPAMYLLVDPDDLKDISVEFKKVARSNPGRCGHLNTYTGFLLWLA